jgi:hypothetical protein
VHDLAGQVQDRGVIVQDEVGVGGQDDAVQLEGELAGVFAGRKFVLLDGGNGTEDRLQAALMTGRKWHL